MAPIAVHPGTVTAFSPGCALGVAPTARRVDRLVGAAWRSSLRSSSWSRCTPPSDSPARRSGTESRAARVGRRGWPSTGCCGGSSSRHGCWGGGDPEPAAAPPTRCVGAPPRRRAGGDARCGRLLVAGVADEPATAAVSALPIGASVGNGVFEELVWRGVCSRLFSNSTLLGIAWPSAWFGLWHLGPASAPPDGEVITLVIGAATFGLHLAYLARRTGSGWRPAVTTSPRGRSSCGEPDRRRRPRTCVGI